MTMQSFFNYARQRHQVYLNRLEGKSSLTKDPILQKYRFTNVFRELDKTTDWFRRNVREEMRDSPDVLLATVVFRMFNRISTGEAIFNHLDFDKNNAFAVFLQTGDLRRMKKDVKAICGDGPYVTGAYIITSPPGFTKLDGILEILKNFREESGWRDAAKQMIKEKMSLQTAWLWFKMQPWLGTFHSYEIVTDLRHTNLLCHANDVMSWCNVGPGARRGLNRIHGRNKKDKSVKVPKMLEEMQLILAASRSPGNWPRQWPEWEMRDVEHTLCEFDKYERVRNGEGRPRGVFA